MKTSEEFLKEIAYKHEISEKSISYDNCIEYLIEFAKLHVTAALEPAAEKAYYRDFNEYVCRSEENKQSILTAYPLDNIK